MRRNKIMGLLGAFILAALGTTALTVYVRTAHDRAVAGEELVDVLVIDQAVAAGTPASELAQKVRKDQVPVKVRPEAAVANLQELAGLVAAVDLQAGEQLLRTRFQSPAVKTSSATCSTKTTAPAGMHEVTIKLDAIRAVGGSIRAGTTVGLNASFDKEDSNPAVTKTLLHKVLVTCVSSTLVEQKPEAGASPVIGSELLITLAVEPANVEKVIFAAEYGRMYLTLEPKDAVDAPTQPQTRAVVVK
jgi:pilus assembly protein CpaB